MSFLPSGYEAPKSGMYMNFKPGENRIRILGEYDKGTLAIGWEYWIHDHNSNTDKPVRRTKKDDELDSRAVIDRYNKKNINHFWGFPVYNYASGQIEWLSVTQVSIQRGIEQLVNDPDWGKPIGYDIKIIKETGERTNYSVKPVPHKPLPQEIVDQYESMTVDKDSWLNGGDPFNGNKSTSQVVVEKTDDIDLDDLDF